MAAMCEFCSRLVNLGRTPRPGSCGDDDDNVVFVEMGPDHAASNTEHGPAPGDGEEHARDVAAPSAPGPSSVHAEVPPEEAPRTKLIEFILQDGTSTFLVGHLSPSDGGYEI